MLSYMGPDIDSLSLQTPKKRRVILRADILHVNHHSKFIHTWGFIKKNEQHSKYLSFLVSLNPRTLNLILIRIAKITLSIIFQATENVMKTLFTKYM